MRRVAVIASASGSGKTTASRALAARLGVRHVELDALNHGPGWVEATADELRARLEPLVAEEGWVIDGGYRSKLGHLVLDAADVVVWIDVPRRVWLPRLVRRSLRRVVRGEELWNGNRESLRDVFVGRDALIPFALRTFGERRRRYPVELAHLPVVRLRSQVEIDRFVSGVGSPTAGTPDPPAGGTRPTA